MPNPHLFDSDWDYYDACLTPAQRMANTIIEGDSDTLANEYADWVAANKLEELTEKVEWVDEFTRWKVDSDGEP